jgi:cytochrome P450
MEGNRHMSIFDAVKHIPSTALLMTREITTQVSEQFGGADQPLADPPAGSGLQPLLGEPGPPIVGHTLTLLRNPIDLADDRFARHGQLTWMRAFGAPILLALGPDAASEILRNRDKAFANGPGWETYLGPFFRRGLMLLDFDEHLHHRRIMQQAFTNERLSTYLATMNQVIAEGMDDWPISGEMQFYPSFKQLTLDLASVVFLGHPVNVDSTPLHQAFFDTVQATTAVVRHDIPKTRWHRGLAGRAVLEQLIRNELPHKRTGHGDDLFASLCRAEDLEGHTFTDDDVVNHMIFLLMAAHDTSTTTLTSVVYQLACHPEWQERLRAESMALGVRELRIDDIAALPAHDMVIKEAQRLLAPVPAISRAAIKDTSVLGRYIPAGTRVTVFPHYFQTHSQYWPDPLRFDPERFSPERAHQLVHRDAWMPFGAGVHKCIGMRFGTMEIVTALHHMLLRYRWRVEPGYKMPLNLTALPYPTDGLPITIAQVAPSESNAALA